MICFWNLQFENKRHTLCPCILSSQGLAYFGHLLKPNNKQAVLQLQTLTENREGWMEMVLEGRLSVYWVQYMYNEKPFEEKAREWMKESM